MYRNFMQGTKEANEQTQQKCKEFCGTPCRVEYPMIIFEKIFGLIQTLQTCVRKEVFFQDDCQVGNFLKTILV